MRKLDGHAQRDLATGLKLALADDGKIGPNDIAGLKSLAGKAGGRALARSITALATPYAPPARIERREGTGYARRVVDFKPGSGAGFNADKLEVALGRPEGAGSAQGSLHVVSLGRGGQITLELGRAVTRGLAVFENALASRGRTLNAEPARVEVSSNGAVWYELVGTAGNKPVFANSTNHLHPRSLAAGGDRFSFREAGIPKNTAIRFVRITDLGQSEGPANARGGITGGFDLDAVYGY